MSGVDKDGLSGDERKKLGEVQDVLEQFAPASAYHGDRNLREMGEAMLAQFTGLAKTRYDAGEATAKLQQTSAYYDHAIEKSKPVHQTDLDKNWIQQAAAQPARWRSRGRGAVAPRPRAVGAGSRARAG